MSTTELASSTSTAVQALVRLLEDEGVTHVFGIPGGPLMPFYEAMFDRGRIRPIIAKHEGGAAFMADGYARASGRLGVCCATTGPGATNALTGIACAQRDSIPVMLVTAQVAVSVFGKGAAQESSAQALDIVDLYRAATRASLPLVSPERIEETAQYLLRRALTGRTGPVHFNLPADLMKRQVPATPKSQRPYRVRPRCFDRASVKEACRLLAQARRPAILAGYGVYLSRAWEELQTLAERLRIPVATTPKAKGVFPENHPLSLGVHGLAGCPQAEAYLLGENRHHIETPPANGRARDHDAEADDDQDVDVLMVVGSSLGEEATHCWDARLQPSETMIHLDIDPTEIGKNYHVDVGMVGDARAALTEMRFEVERQLQCMSDDDGPDLDQRGCMVDQFKRVHPRFVETAGFEDTSAPLKPQRLIRELERALPDDALLFVDIGNVMTWALHYFQVRRPGMFHINLGLASMGHAVASSIGAKLGAPERPVVALVGDAAFAMNGMEVHAAVEADVPVVWIVMNNGGHGMVCHGERLQFKGKFQTGKFRTPLHIAKLAEGMGARAQRVEDPADFAGALRQALAAGEPVVLDVLTDPETMPPMGMRIKTLDKFFEAGEETPADEPAPASASPKVVVTARDIPLPRRGRKPTSREREPATTNGKRSGPSNGERTVTEDDG